MSSTPHKKFSFKSLRFRFKSSPNVHTEEDERPAARRVATEPPEDGQSHTTRSMSFEHTSVSATAVHVEHPLSHDILPSPPPGLVMPTPEIPAPSQQEASSSTTKLAMPVPDTSGAKSDPTLPIAAVAPEQHEDEPVQMPIPDPATAPHGSAIQFLSVHAQLPPVVNGSASAMSGAQPSTSQAEAGDVVDGLADVARKVQDGKPKTSQTRSRALGDTEALEDKVTALSAKVTDVTQAAQPLVAMVEASGAVQMIKSGLNSFMEDIPWLMKSLDEVAKIHPFVQVAVLAFKAVYTMEMTRRQNDKRIITLYVSMKDMIEVLVQLRNVKDPKDVGPDGRTIEARMQSIAGQAASDIKSCANVCDTYNKKKLLVKVLKGQVWEAKLVSWVDTFTKRKTEFEFALAVHTARAVDSVKTTVENMDQKLESMTATLMEVFKQLASPEELDLARRIEAKGGIQAVQEKDSILREFLQEENSESQKTGSKGGRANPQGTKSVPANLKSSGRSNYTLHDLKEDLREDWETAITNNLQVFEGKFTLQQRQMQEELSIYIHDESNRVIDAVNSGPHDLIKQPELKAIWKEMGWRLNVKARLFVMTLRDNFSETPTRTSNAVASALGEDPVAKRKDDWALQFISIANLQHIMEAFDDDGSGYITLSEVNKFVDALPLSLDWGLTHWIAYWAVGWQQTAASYCTKILNIFDHMNVKWSSILPENKCQTEYYLRKVWQTAYEFCRSLRPPQGLPDWLEAKFEDYVKYEEDRMRKNLQEIHYDIDALDTVYIVSGPGRIEKNFFILLYLLLERDLQIFEAAKTKYLNKEELWDSADSILWLYSAMWYRYNDLKAFFTQQKLDVAEQFKMYACEMFEYYNDNSSLFANSRLATASFMSYDVSDEPVGNWSKDVDPLNYPVAEKYPYDYDAFEPLPALSEETYSKADPALKPLLGLWNGFIYEEEEYPSFFITSICICPSDDGNGAFKAEGKFGGDAYLVNGRCEQDAEGFISFEFNRSYTGNFLTEYFHGHVTPDGTLVGSQGYEEDHIKHSAHFFLKRTPAEIICHRPPPHEFEANKPKALWKYASQAIRHQVLKERWSWKYFAQRRDLRQQYLQTHLRLYSYGRGLSPDEQQLRRHVRQSLMPQDYNFYDSLFKYQLKMLPEHTEYSCDSCGNSIGGARIMCLDCRPPEATFSSNTVDLCDDPVCRNAIIPTSKRTDLKEPHVPTHVVLKLRTELQIFEHPSTDRTARNALGAARALFTTGVQNTADKALNTGSHEDAQERSQQQTAQGPNNDAYPVKNDLANSEALADGKDEGQVAVVGDGKLEPATNVSCNVCGANVQQPCWFCVDCYIRAEPDYVVLCDDCEGKTLLSCVNCHQPYRQPTWFYGFYEAENFMCNTCNAKRIVPPEIEKYKQHTYLHNLVRCSPARQASEEVSQEERILSLEETVAGLGDKISSVEGHLEEMRSMLSQILAQMSSTQAK